MSPSRKVRGRRVAGLRVALDARIDAVEDESILHRDFWRVPAWSPLRLVSTSERLMS